MIPEEDDRERLTTLLGRPLHRYADIARTLAAAWPVHAGVPRPSHSPARLSTPP